MNEAAAEPAIQYVTQTLSRPLELLTINGMFIRQRVGIDPLYDGPLYDGGFHDREGSPVQPNAHQIAAANRVIDGSKDPEPVLTRLMKCKGFVRIEPSVVTTPVTAAPVTLITPAIATETHGIALVEKEVAAANPSARERYPLAIPPDAMFGKLAAMARETECPLSWAYTSLLAYYAGLGINMHDADPKVHPTVYVALLGDVEDGKSVTMKRTRQKLGIKPEETFPSPASDRGLISSFRIGPDGAPLDKKEKPGVLFAGTVVADEMREMMSKMAIQGSTLAPRLCELWSTDTLSASDKFGVQTMKARVSLLGNLKIKDRDEFPILFAGNTQDGLFSRMILAPGPKAWDFNWKWEPGAPALYVEADVTDSAEVSAAMSYQPYPRPRGRVTIANDSFNMLDEWKQAHRDNGVKAGRAGEIALRVAVISASANGDSIASTECMKAALAFADWQIEVKKVYAAGEGRNDNAILTGLIEDAFIEIDDAIRTGKPMKIAGKPLADGEGFVPFHLLEKKKRWGRTFSANALSNVLRSMASMQILEQYYELNKEVRIYQNRYRLNNDQDVFVPVSKTTKE